MYNQSYCSSYSAEQVGTARSTPRCELQRCIYLVRTRFVEAFNLPVDIVVNVSKYFLEEALEINLAAVVATTVH